MDVGKQEIRYENPLICAKCGGKCCKHIPGAAMPSDFDEPIVESLTKALKSGKWMIDWYYGTESNEPDKMPFLRPKQISEKAKILEFVDYSCAERGWCSFLTETGCSLSYERRPTECRRLEPRENGSCVDHTDGRKEFGLAWLPYYCEIKEALSNVGIKLDSEEG